MTIDMFAMLERVTRLVEEDKPDEAYKVIKGSVDEDQHGFARLFLSAWITHLAGEGEPEQSKFAEILIYLKEDFPELATGLEQKPMQPAASPAPPAMPLWLAPFDNPRPATAVTELVAPEPAVEPEKAEEQVSAEVIEAESKVAMPEAPVEEPAEADQPVEVTTTATQPEVEPETEPVKSVPVAPEAEHEPEVAEELDNLTLTFYEWQMSAIRKAANKEQVHEGALLTRMLETRKLEPLMWSRYRHGNTSSPTQRITIAIPHKTKVTIEKDKDFEGIKTTTKYVRKVLFGARAEKA